MQAVPGCTASRCFMRALQAAQVRERARPEHEHTVSGGSEDGECLRLPRLIGGDLLPSADQEKPVVDACSRYNRRGGVKVRRVGVHTCGAKHPPAPTPSARSMRSWIFWFGLLEKDTVRPKAFVRLSMGAFGGLAAFCFFGLCVLPSASSSIEVSWQGSAAIIDAGFFLLSLALGGLTSGTPASSGKPVRSTGSNLETMLTKLTKVEAVRWCVYGCAQSTLAVGYCPLMTLARHQAYPRQKTDCYLSAKLSWIADYVPAVGHSLHRSIQCHHLISAIIYIRVDASHIQCTARNSGT